MELKEVFEPLINFLKNLQKKEKETASKDKAKERLQLVLMQDRASVSPDFFEMMKKEIIDVIKKYIEIDEESLEVELTRGFEDESGTGPALYANIPIKNIKPVAKKFEEKEDIEELKENKAEEISKEEVKVDENIEQVETNKEENNNQKIEEVEQETKESKEEVQMTPEATEVVAEQVTNDVVENAKDNAEELKEKIAEVKEGVTETIEKVKKGAKDGIKKIKSKTQKKVKE